MLFSACVCVYVCLCMFSHIRLFVTPWTVASQAPLPMGYLKGECCRGLPVPPPRDIPDPGIEPLFPESPASVQFSSVAKLCLTLCNPKDCSTPGFHVHHQTLEFVQAHVNQVGDVIQTSYPMSSPFPPAFYLSQVLPHETVLHIRWPKYRSFSFSISSSNEYSGLISFMIDCFDILQSKGLSRVFSNTPVQKHSSSALSFLYSPTLTSIHDYWKNHSFDWMHLCWHSNV